MIAASPESSSKISGKVCLVESVKNAPGFSCDVVNNSTALTQTSRYVRFPLGFDRDYNPWYN